MGKSSRFVALVLIAGANVAFGAQPSSGGPIEEIVVTAQKKTSTAQETPIALTALTSEAIEATAAYSPERLQYQIPSMTYGQQSGYSFITIRGVGTDLTVTSGEPSIATYEDGVYTGSLMAQNVPSYDLERIEVLRGPQGTLYGRNANGGVVNFITKNPSFEPGATVIAGFGDYEAWNVGGAVTGGIIDGLVAGRLSVDVQSRDYYRNNLYDGRDEDDLDHTGVRGSLLVTPTDEFNIILRAGYYEHDTSVPYELITSEANLSNPATDPFTTLTGENVVGTNYGPLPLGVFSLPAEFFEASPGFLSPADIALLNGGSIADYYGLSAAGGVPPDPNKTTDVGTSVSSRYDVNGSNFSVEMDWDTGPVSVKSITAYRYNKLEFDQDSGGAGTPVTVFYPLENDSKQFTQEFNLAGNAFDERLEWLVGGFYLRERANINTTVFIPTEGENLMAACSVTAGLFFLPGCTTDTGGYAFSLVPVDQFAYGFLQLFPDDPLARATIDSPPFGLDNQPVQSGTIPRTAFLGFETEQTSESAAGFLQATYHMTDDFRVTGGVRYTSDRKDVVRSLHSNLIATLINLGFAAPAAPDGTPTLCDTQVEKKSWNKTTGTISVDYDFTDDVMGYASVSLGYKAGGFNPGECGEPFDPEDLTAYEVGVKSLLANGQAQVNAALYFYDYDDIQFTLYVPNQSFIRNAGTAEILGAEVEFMLRPSFLPGLSLDGSVSWIDSEYGKGAFQDPAGIVPIDPITGEGGIPIDGNPLIRAPEWKFNASAAYTFDLNDLGLLTFRVDGSYSDNYYNDIFAGTAPLQSATEQDSYWVGDFLVSWETQSGRYQLQGFVRNFTDEYYATNRVSFNTPVSLVTVAGQYAPPRTYGARLTMNFGN